MPSEILASRLLLLLGVLCFVGCGGAAKTNTAKLKGQVTVDNQPVEQGSLQFLPAGEGQAAGAEIKNGSYEADVPLGKMRVVLTATRATGRTIQEYSSSFPEVVNIIPPQYAQGIEIEVAGDKPDQHFALTSK